MHAVWILAYLEGECPFCPWPPGQNTNSWLVAEACNGNKSPCTPPKRIHTVTHRPAPSAYCCTRQIPSLYVLWQDSSPFFSSQCNLFCCLHMLCAWPHQRRAHGGCWAFLHQQWMNTPFTLTATTLSFFLIWLISVYYVEPLLTFAQMTPFDFDYSACFPASWFSLHCPGSSHFHQQPTVIWALKSPVHSSFAHLFSLCLPSRQTPS